MKGSPDPFSKIWHPTKDLPMATRFCSHLHFERSFRPYLKAALLPSQESVLLCCWISQVTKKEAYPKLHISAEPKFRDVGSISNLGGTTLRGHLFLKKKGAFSKNLEGTSLFISKSWGHISSVPLVSTSMVNL